MDCIWILISLTQKQSIDDEQLALIAYVIFVMLLLAVMVILFFITFQKRKNQLLQDKLKQEQAFGEEILRIQEEIQEETLKHVGWELHDNVGQLLAYASMQLNTLTNKASEDLKPKVDETSNIVKDSLKEVRALSRSLNNEMLLDMGFQKSISNELDRLKRMQFESVELETKGITDKQIDPRHEIFLFRILQEFFSNSVKYSKATTMTVTLDYQEDNLKINARDNGEGFDMNATENGSGFLNMKSRAEMINTAYHLHSSPGQGVSMELIYPFNS